MRAVVVALLLVGCVRSAPPPAGDASPQRLAQDGTPIELSLVRYPDRARWKLSEHRGRVVLLDVWATWCEPCRDALPVYQDLSKEYAGRGLDVFAVNVDGDANVIAPFLAESNLSLPVLLDPEAAVATATLHVRLMPTTYVIDRAGRVRHVHEGFNDAEFSTVLQEIEALLAEPAK
ncbi:MAG TPA: TlpA disulfide reductase family protein [Archangium sp.]